MWKCGNVEISEMWKSRFAARLPDFQISTFPDLQIASPLAAVDDDGRAADPGRPGRGEEGDDGGDFFGAAEAAERQLVANHARDAFGIGLLPAVPRAAGEHDRSWRDAVDADVRRRELLS